MQQREESSFIYLLIDRFVSTLLNVGFQLGCKIVLSGIIFKLTPLPNICKLFIIQMFSIKKSVIKFCVLITYLNTFKKSVHMY